MVKTADSEGVSGWKPDAGNRREDSVHRDTRAIVIRDYRILELLGRGGMGSVYRAWHERMNRQVAIKFLNSAHIEADEAVQRFTREVRLLAKLEHAHIVRALDAGEHEGRPYFVMEFISGPNLSQVVRRLGPLPVADVARIGHSVAIALQYAHEQKVIHRDVKPSNVMVTTDGKVKLLDLGLAQILERDTEETLSRASQVLGTLAYMSPEQLTGNQSVTPLSDIFSLGVMLHELLTGRRPVERPGLSPVVSSIRSVRPDVGPHMEELIQSMLSFEPSQRPIGMSEIAARLSQFPMSESLVPLVAEYFRWDKRNEATPAGLSAGLVTPSPLQIEPNAFKRQTRRWSPMPMLLMASMVATLLACGYLLYRDYFKDAPLKESALATNLGTVVVESEGNVGNVLLAESKVSLVREGNQRVRLKSGENSVPPGQYRVELDGPEEMLQDDAELTVIAAETFVLPIRPILTKPFQFPDIPSKAGSFATYHGSLGRSDWGISELLGFHIYLEVMQHETSDDMTPLMWLKLEVSSKSTDVRESSDDYLETAYLGFDYRTWETERVLAVQEGWIVASSRGVEDYVKGLPSGQALDGELIVPFDQRHDLLQENHSQCLPNRRLSVHDVLSLFFGQEMPAAGGAINAVRSLLPSIGDRKTSLQMLDAGHGEQQCFVVSSRLDPKERSIPGFMMARRKSDRFNPFGFVMLEVNFPSQLVASCLKKNANQVEPRHDAWKRRLEQLRRGAFRPDVPANSIADKSEPVPPTERAQTRDFPWIRTAMSNILSFVPSIFGQPPKPEPPLPPREDRPLPLPRPTTSRFDLATLPLQSAEQSFHGNIRLNANHSELITANLKLQGSQQHEGRECQWLDLEVVSRAMDKDYTEYARLLIDSMEYQRSGVFLIKKGWIAFEKKSNILELPSDYDLDALIDARLQLQGQPQWNRVGIQDVLVMLFDCQLKPRTTLGTLRAKFGEMLSGISRNVTYEDFQHKGGELLPCERWQSPIYLKTHNYSFLRSSRVPFAFVAVKLNSDDIKISLEADSYRVFSENNASSSIFGSMSQLESLLAQRDDRLKPVPNWQVWTWTSAGTTYKAWAEFGGILSSSPDSMVLLRDAQGRQIAVPEMSLSDANRQVLKKGRFWSKRPFTDRWRILEEHDKTTNILTFSIPESKKGVDIATCRLSELDEEDRAWVEKLRMATYLPVAKLASPQAWSDFAGYVR
jgi:serine/threonine protein kinase